MGRKAALIYVDKTVYGIDMPFSYLVSDEIWNHLQRGCRVLVPFGNANKKVQGLVSSLYEEENGEARLKPISAQLDREPVFTEEMFQIMDFLVEYTFCTYYEAIRTILPNGVNIEIIESYQLKKEALAAYAENFTQEQQNLLKFLKTAKTAKELTAFLDVRKNPGKSPVVQSLLALGVIERLEQTRQKTAPKTIRMIKINPDAETSLLLSKKQAEVLRILSEQEAMSVKELCYYAGVTQAVVRTLLKKGILYSFEQESETSSYLPPSSAYAKIGELTLSESQSRAAEGIWELFEKGKPACALLHGVTGSGKTQIYSKLIEWVVNAQKSALMLVPEIALTPQLVTKFKEYFGAVIAVIHSGLSSSERMREYDRIKKGEAKIVIGTRSAIFAPLSSIGMIILDEEGESSYKSDASPRYHTREVAKLRCRIHNAVLLLGSATPSIDSYYHALKGDYSLFTLENRFASANLPNVYLINMLEEQKKKNFATLSELLQEQLAINLKNGEQSILLINRRGYHTFATCMQCSQVLTCPSCSVALTYHKPNDSLMCHYCGHVEPFVSHCPSCGGNYLKLTGTGTQKLQDELAQSFPEARILRMDADTTYSRDSFEQNFEAFKKGSYEILLGTQMIAKGLDFPNVTLVGVIHADAGLYSSDYRASERVFSLITQVVGRSGRSEKSGRAYIQSFDPKNPVIQLAAKQDYRDFYQDEILTRRTLFYPPFCDILLLGFAAEDEERVKQAAMLALKILKEEALKEKKIAMKVLGIAPASVYRISGKFRYRMILKCRFNRPMREMISRVLRRASKDRAFSGVSLTADLNGDMS